MRNENMERGRRRKPITKAPELVRSVKAGQVISASFGRETKVQAELWKRAS